MPKKDCYIFTAEQELRIVDSIDDFEDSGIFPRSPISLQAALGAEYDPLTMPCFLRTVDVMVMCLRRAFLKEEDALASLDEEYLTKHLRLNLPADLAIVENYRRDRNFIGCSLVRALLMIALNACIRHGVHLCRETSDYFSSSPPEEDAGDDEEDSSNADTDSLHRDSYMALIRELIAIGGPVGITDMSHWEQYSAELTILRGIKKWETLYSPIFLAVAHGCIGAVELLLSTNAVDLNVHHDVHSETLHMCTLSSSPRRREIDLSAPPPVSENGFQPLSCSMTPTAPLHLALVLQNSVSFKDRFTPITEALLRHGAPLGPPRASTRTDFWRWPNDPEVKNTYICPIFGDTQKNPLEFDPDILLMLSHHGADFSPEAFRDRHMSPFFKLLVPGKWSGALPLREPSILDDRKLPCYAERDTHIRNCYRDFAPIHTIMATVLGLNQNGLRTPSLFDVDPGDSRWFAQFDGWFKGRETNRDTPLIVACSTFPVSADALAAIRSLVRQIEFYASNLNPDTICGYIHACHTRGPSRCVSSPPPTFTAEERSNTPLLVRRLVATFINLRDSRGNTALHFACALGFVVVVNQLLKLSADVNARNRRGQTPLHFVCMTEREKAKPLIVQKLLDCGADPEARCLHKACTPYELLAGTGPLTQKRERDGEEGGEHLPHTEAGVSARRRRIEGDTTAVQPLGDAGDSRVVPEPVPSSAAAPKLNAVMRKIRGILAKEMITRPDLAGNEGGNPVRLLGYDDDAE